MAAAGVKILRWVKIRSAANPYDPAWELYLEERSVLEAGAIRWRVEAGSSTSGREQEGRCVVCGQMLRVEEQPWHIHHRIWRSRGGGDDVRQPGVVARQLPSADPHRKEMLTELGCVSRGAFVKA